MPRSAGDTRVGKVAGGSFKIAAANSIGVGPANGNDPLAIS